MLKNAYESFKELPPYARGIIAIVVVGGTALLIYSGIKTVIDDARNRKLLVNLNNDIDKFKADGEQESYTPSQYQEFANEIESDIGKFVNDGYSHAEHVLKSMNNNLDVALLMKEFGDRQQYWFGLDAGKALDLLSFASSGFRRESISFITDRVDSVNEDWKGKGITYKL